MIVVLDACVLVPAALRDTLLIAATDGFLYEFWYSDAILDELERTLVDDIGVTPASAARLRNEIVRVSPGRLDFVADAVVNRMTNDADDRHVLAAAAVAGAEMLVTGNIRHFPASSCAPLGIVALTPDQCLVGLYERAPAELELVIQTQASQLRNPPAAYDDVLHNLAVEAPRFVQLLRQHRS